MYLSRTSTPVRRLAIAALFGAAAIGMQAHGALAGPSDNSLIVGIATDLVQADPANGTLGTDIPILYTMYDRLLDFTPADLTLRPMLATDWKWSDDRKTLILTLRQGVKFHDGTDFNAEAVKTSLEYFKTSGTNKDLDGVTKIEVVDPYTVALTTETVNSSLPGLLAERAGMILSPTAIEKYGKENYGANPVGTGPFKMSRRDSGSAVFVEKFADYWNKDEPKLDKIEFRVLKNPASAVSAMMTGQIDYLPSVDPVNVPVMKNNPNVRIETEPTLGFGIMNLNTAMAPLDKPEARRAVAMSIDREALAKAVYGNDVKTGGANLPVPPGYYPSTPELEQLAYDPAKAKELLASAGYPDGITFTLCLNANAGMPQPAAKVGDIMRDQMKAAGITLETMALANNAACSELLSGKKTIPAFLVTWTGRPDPAITYAQVLGTKTFYNAGQTKYANADELIAKLQASFDKEEQEAIYDELNKVWVEQYPMIPIYYFVNVVAYNAGLTGEEPNLLGRPYVRTLHWKK